MSHRLPPLQRKILSFNKDKLHPIYELDHLGRIDDSDEFVPDMSIYIIQFADKNIFKIGVAIDVDKRHSSHQSSSPVKLTKIAHFTVPGEHAYRIESAIKEALAPHKIRGEWFALTLTELARVIVEVGKHYRNTHHIGDKSWR